MRIAIGEFKQESNTFAAAPTTLEHFRSFHLWHGQDMLTNLRDTNTEVGGFIDVLEENEAAIVPTLAGFAISGAPLTRKAYTTLRDDLLDRLSAAQPVDAVLLSLRGAMVAEHEDDPDGVTLESVRGLIGPDVPLVVTMDLHANVTRRCIDCADVIVGFKTCPHVDQRETGRRAARILVRWLRGDVQPTMAHTKIPMIAPASTHVHFTDGPFKRLMDATRSAETDGALAASTFTVQPWLDVPEMGFSTVVVTDDDPALAEEITCRLAERAWSERDAFMDVELVPPDEAIRRALAHPTGPVVLSDLADGTGAGSPGDATAMIAALLDVDPPKPALIYVYDPEVAATAAEIGVGGDIDVLVGGKIDNLYNEPIRVRGTIVFAEPAQFQFGGDGYTGITMDMGLSAVIRQNNVYLLVVSNSVMTVDPAIYRAVGLEPAEAEIVVVKSHIQFRAGYGDLAQDMILLDTPGMSSDHLTELPFRRIDRPMFPLDSDIAYECSPYSRTAK